MSRKLSERAKVLLWIVNENTERDWSTGRLDRFFVPRADIYWVPGVKGGTHITGSGDASAFRGLERAGLIERPKTALQNPHVYAITEQGLMAVESFRAEFEDRAERYQRALNEADTLS